MVSIMKTNSDTWYTQKFQFLLIFCILFIT